MPIDDRLDSATCVSIREHAWTLLMQGQSQQAIDTLHDLLARLAQQGLADGRDPITQQALILTVLGRVYYRAGQPDLAREPLHRAIALFEQIGEAQQCNLSAPLGDLAHAHLDLGQHTAALRVAEQALAIDRHLGHSRNIATGLDIIGHILMEMQHYAEADVRYQAAQQAAQEAVDINLECIILNHRGELQRRLENYEQAVTLYQQAMRLYQQAGDQIGEMQTSDMLGSAEMQRNNLEAAQAWYERARELAQKLNDRKQEGVVAQNLGILYQSRAERSNDPAQRDALLHQAVQSIQESLIIALERQDQIGTAVSYTQLGVLFRMLGDLAQAEHHLQQAWTIRESLDHPRLFIVYGELAHVTHARGDTAAAAAWQIKREAKEAELVRRRGVGGQMPPLVRFEPLLRAIAAVARGDDTQRAGIEAMFPQMRAGDWGAMPGVIRRIWAGERALAALAQGLDVVLTALVARILQFVADPDAPPLLPEEEEQSE